MLAWDFPAFGRRRAQRQFGRYPDFGHRGQNVGHDGAAAANGEIGELHVAGPT